MINSIAVTQARDSSSGSGIKSLAISSDVFQSSVTTPSVTTIDKDSRAFVLQLAQRQLGVLASKGVTGLSEQDVDNAMFLSDLIEELNEEEAYEASHQFIEDRMRGFSEYLYDSAEDLQVVQAVQTEGGAIVGDYDEFFAAEDSDGNRYIIDKTIISQEEPSI